MCDLSNIALSDLAAEFRASSRTFLDTDEILKLRYTISLHSPNYHCSYDSLVNESWGSAKESF